ncbi:aldose epimerase family protein [Salipiger sp.]|uniref:aldose epimerase family protein n=1 Tax=Salipiger sp. TaxID=2078585 RepID=UPI003A96F376
MAQEQVSVFGTLPDGRQVMQVDIGSGALRASLLTHGARLRDLRLDGVPHPLVLGASSLAPYLGDMVYFGATVGRYANRIGGGRFTLYGREFTLDRNEGGRTCLHGGSDGTGALVWELVDHGADHATFALELPDGHMGFPGVLAVTTTYRCHDSALEVVTEATPSAPCPLSFAHHSYFALTDDGDIARCRLEIAAERYLPVDAEQIPTGELAAVEGTPFDFRSPRELGRQSIDHNFCLQPAATPAARFTAPSGLQLEVETEAPGLQVYTADHIAPPATPDPEIPAFGPRSAIALETQEWPDAPNKPAFPDPVIRPGQTYRNATIYRFRQT